MKSVLCVLAALLMFSSAHVANAATVPAGFTDSLGTATIQVTAR